MEKPATKAPEPLGRRIVTMVTGAQGFLGRRILGKLLEGGISRLPLTRGAYDLTHEAEAALAIAAARPTHIIHTAFHRGGPGAAFRHNMAMGMNVIHSAAVMGARVVLPQVYYGALPWERQGAVDIDATREAQRSLEKMCEGYDRQHGDMFDCALVRLPTLYGAASSRPDPVSLAATAIWNASIREEPECTVPFCPSDEYALLHVEDAATAIVKIALSDAEGPCRVKPTASIPMGAVIEMAVKLTQYKGRVRVNKEPLSEPMLPAPEDDSVHEISLDAVTPLEVGVADVFRGLAPGFQYGEEVKNRPADSSAPPKNVAAGSAAR